MTTVVQTYQVWIEVRKRGALGVFSPKAYSITAVSEGLAKSEAFDRAQCEGLETRFIAVGECPIDFIAESYPMDSRNRSVRP